MSKGNTTEKFINYSNARKLYWKTHPEELEKLRKRELGNKRGLGNRSNLGRKWTKELHKKMVEARKDVDYGKGHRGKKNPELLKRNLLAIGDKNPNWRGGISTVAHRIRTCLKYKQWVKMIFERDDYICLFCNQRGGKLNADHIIQFSDILNKIKFQFGIENLYARAMEDILLWDTSNGRTLCLKCHKSTSNYLKHYGRKK